MFCQNMAPRRAVNARNDDQPPPPLLARTAEELDALLEERISVAIAQYEANRTQDSGGPSNARRNGHGDSSGGNAAQGCTFKQFLDCKPMNYDGIGGAVAFVRWTEKTEATIRMSKCTADQQVTFATGLFVDEALTWWNLQVQTPGDEAAYGMTWDELKEKMREKYCSRAELQRLETEFWHLTMVGADITGYTRRFHDLSRVIPYMVTPEFKRVERYIWGLAPEFRGMVTSAKPQTITEAVTLAVSLTEDCVRMEKLSLNPAENTVAHAESSGDKKRKHSSLNQATRNNKGSNKKRDTNPSKEANAAAKGYQGTMPKCQKCKYHHDGACRIPRCDKCGRLGHQAEDCWGKGKNRNGNGAGNKNGNGKGRNQGCFHCGSNDHFMKDCPKKDNAQARAFVIGAKDAREDPNVVTGTFLINSHFASILFDTGADYSFMSVEFKRTLGIESSRLDIPYSIELANGRLVESGKVVRDCTLELGERRFSIDLLPIQLGSFDVVVGMDWLSKNKAEVICHEKIIRIPLANEETLIVHGEKRDAPLRIISCIKAQKCLRKGCVAFLAHVVDKKAEEPKLEDIPVVKEFPDFFPKTCQDYLHNDKSNSV
ncbi:putative transcription factor interactor and regulator CCHC(Zn) family [Helianthus annuus]|uniref:Transcription factor interactor and regulator CCHC(Zn) family n=1 Tax=Helianthus annuus TaxID=4232 RepID=A0A9K3NK50_HELAN|nr:putative transcription factor interactor and regulator CCHC(Zn) family [Helianthus annuus]KAJ0567848.1 putative transcription factor interactor and regulator CCHC(Zn) family [Helianthus annuus]KAJ0574296.1 putative transcription factor interactor and regulator CCHC(Zn) family [Helianthus annuus]KAJ0738632.1 putative transcription factor interactor and regulator CCHC(Zn) family [Helianthus annuus]KAJ0912802.1 putative transcription factor interactor and regulator CCHC(Zn) family [Helianthus a